MKKVKSLAKYAFAYTIMTILALQAVRPLAGILKNYMWEDLALTLSCLSGVVLFGILDILLLTYGRRLSGLVLKPLPGKKHV